MRFCPRTDGQPLRILRNTSLPHPQSGSHHVAGSSMGGVCCSSLLPPPALRGQERCSSGLQASASAVQICILPEAK